MTGESSRVRPILSPLAWATAAVLGAVDHGILAVTSLVLVLLTALNGT